ncbi:MAG: putative XRE-type DNA-binding protein [Planctomycetota bacterium]|jgi:predicted XRE-type DNA-binding protein
MILIKILLHFVLFSNNANDVLTDEFYSALASNDQTKIALQLNKLDLLKRTNLNQAYIATLKLKKSSFEKVLKTKITIFKEGATSLDLLIDESPQNTELRFLRCIIQENAPKILKYNTNLEVDKQLVIKEFKNQNKNLQKHILQYAKNSNLFPELVFSKN